jgi:hypothetical protein
VYYTDDITLASPVWNRFDNGIPHVMIWDMAIHPLQLQCPQAHQRRRQHQQRPRHPLLFPRPRWMPTATPTRTPTATATPTPTPTPLPTTAAPKALKATNETASSFTANRTSVSGALGYRLDILTNSSFTNYVPGYQDLDVGNRTSYNATGLSANTFYYYRLRAYNGGDSGPNSKVR